MAKCKKTFVSLCALLLAGTLFGGIANLVTTSADDGAQTPAATYLKTDESTQGAWKTAGYGQKGYLIFDGYRNGAGVGFYSDMYNAASTGTTVAETTLMAISGAYNTGWTAVGNGGWDLTKNPDGTIAMANATTKSTTANTDSHALKSDAIITSWGVNTQSFQGHGARPFKPYIPGTTTNTQLRMHGKVESGYYADSNVGFKLNTTDKVNVTLQIHDYAGGGGNTATTTDSVVAVYDTAYRGGQLSFQMAIGKQTIADCYGDEPLDTTDVTVNGSYVTFTLDGSVSQDYTFVVYREDATATGINPSIGGVFFDEYKEPVKAVAAYAGYDVTNDGTQWESAGYGTDGYVVYYTEDGATYQAYTKGIYKNTDGTDYTGLVTYTGAVTEAHNEWTADKELSGKIITRYANAFGPGGFSTIAEKSWKNDYATGTLTKPGTSDPTWTRISTPRNTGNGVTAFTVSEEALKNNAALEVTIFHSTAYGPMPTAAAPVFTTAIYNLYNCGNGDSNDVKATPLASATISLSQHTPMYVTYRITAPGDYTVYLFDYDNTVRATTTGVFFDFVNQGVGNVSYELDGGENDKDNPVYYALGKTTALADASKEGYTFDGWYTDSAFTQKVTEISATQTGNIALYAKFTKEYRTFNVTYVTESGAHTNPATYTEGTAVPLTDATKDGYTFGGWYMDIALTQRVTEISATQTGDLTLYAKFTKIAETFDITYVADGGTHANPATYTEGTLVVLTDATKDGYAFGGWFTDAAFTNQITMILSTQTGDVTLYAKFTKIIVTSNIIYVVDGGTHANPATYTEGTAVTLADATKDGYTFDGWYMDSAFTAKVTEISATQTGDVTLYAKFTEIATEPPVENKGCGGVTAIGGVVLALGVACFALAKRKEND